jgi:hypothetical protein
MYLVHNINQIHLLFKITLEKRIFYYNKERKESGFEPQTLHLSTGEILSH